MVNALFACYSCGSYRSSNALAIRHYERNIIILRFYTRFSKGLLTDPCEFTAGINKKSRYLCCFFAINMIVDFAPNVESTHCASFVKKLNYPLFAILG